MHSCLLETALLSRFHSCYIWVFKLLMRLWSNLSIVWKAGKFPIAVKKPLMSLFLCWSSVGKHRLLIKHRQRPGPQLNFVLSVFWQVCRCSIAGSSKQGWFSREMWVGCFLVDGPRLQLRQNIFLGKLNNPSSFFISVIYLQFHQKETMCSVSWSFETFLEGKKNFRGFDRLPVFNRLGRDGLHPLQRQHLL